MRDVNVFARENKHFHGLRARMLGRYNIGHSTLSPAEWVLKNTFVKSKPWSFKDHEYQIAPLNDMNKRLATEKCAQVGWTEIFLRWSLYWAVTRQGFTTIFTQPSKTEAENFSKSRGRDAIVQCKPAMDMCLTGDIDSAAVKKIGLSYLYFRGTIGKSAAISVPADANVHDEVNFSAPDTKNKFKSRLQHSEFAFERDISTPTIPRYGVSASFDDSDKKYILWRCQSCNEWQQLKWPNSIWFKINGIWSQDMETAIQRRMKGDDVESTYRCCKCEAAINREDNWNWVAENPGRESWAGGVSGYSMSQLDVRWRGPWDIVCASDSRLKGYKLLSDFYNFVLGEPHLGAKDGVNASDFLDITLANEPQHTRGYGYFIGIDVGKICHAVIQDGNNNIVMNEKFSMEVLNDKVDQYHANYNPYAVCLDAMPYELEVSQIIKKHPYTCYKVRFNGKEFKLNEVHHEITHPRTRAVDIVLDAIKSGRYRYFGETKELVSHFENIARISETDPDTGETAFHYINTGPDHFAFASVYCELAKNVCEYVTGASRDNIVMPSITGMRLSL